MPDKEQSPVYPADGSNSSMPDAEAWANHSQEQEQLNRGGISAAREALRRGNTDTTGSDADATAPEASPRSQADIEIDKPE